MKKIIYDLGASLGENIPYYLIKSDLLIVVEANEICCNIIKEKFWKEIKDKKLIVENCIASDEDMDIDDFYIHRTNYLLSQFPKPNYEMINNFIRTMVVKKDIKNLIYKYGIPYYVKIDLEMYDDNVLKRIFNSNIKPVYISAEAINRDVIELFIKIQHYNFFKLIEGQLVDILYKNMKLNINNSIIKYSFPNNSAGPFGNDIPDDWIDRKNFFKLMEIKKTGWYDIHASLNDQPKKIYDLKYYLDQSIKNKKKAKLIKRWRRVISKINFLKK